MNEDVWGKAQIAFDALIFGFAITSLMWMKTMMKWQKAQDEEIIRQSKTIQ